MLLTVVLKIVAKILVMFPENSIVAFSRLSWGLRYINCKERRMKKTAEKRRAMLDRAKPRLVMALLVFDLLSSIAIG